MTPLDVKPYRALLAAKEEDRFTEFLNQLLQDPHVLSGFLRDACELELPADVGPLSARTQLTVTGGRPDLAVTDGKTTYLLFEAKVGSWLHEEQLAPYAEELVRWLDGHPGGTARLYLLSPARALARSLEVGRDQLASASLESVELNGVSWEEAALFFRELSRTAPDARLAVHAADFADLVDWRLQDSLRDFTEEEAALLSDPLAARTINSVRRLMKELRPAIEERIGASGSLSASYGMGFDGYHITVNGRSWWVGFWLDAWESIGSSPLFLQLTGWRGGPIPEFPADLPMPVRATLREDNERLLVPLPIRSGIEPVDLVTGLASTIVEFCERVPESGAES